MDGNTRSLCFIPFFFFIFLLNLVECYIILRKNVKVKLEFYLLSLSLADFLFGINWIVTIIANYYGAIELNYICGNITTYFLNMSIFLVVGIAFERYSAVTKPFTHNFRRFKSVYLTIGATWGLGLVHVAILMLLKAYSGINSRVFVNASTTAAATMILIICYTLMFLSYRKHCRKMKKTQVKLYSQRNLKMFRMSLMMILVVIVTYWPLIICSFFYSFFYSEIFSRLSATEELVVLNVANAMAFSAPLINPIIYFFHKESFLKTFKFVKLNVCCRVKKISC
ncbi:sphingosine 1-phosphate receptor 2-like [Hydractinia symbiolongicarpus]|uniref:sphingosine 1-phosphate receptor 2-like n=1 Tax=Hydractinia symbiolongicarpus TaxID=13093 RepID=UPI0025507206|nr:sphingosine 1-phosphate receptor 2-like [Hydractinia symbiolongicarpus]